MSSTRGILLIKSSAGTEFGQLKELRSECSKAQKLQTFCISRRGFAMRRRQKSGISGLLGAFRSKIKAASRQRTRSRASVSPDSYREWFPIKVPSPDRATWNAIENGGRRIRKARQMTFESQAATTRLASWALAQELEKTTFSACAPLTGSWGASR